MLTFQYRLYPSKEQQDILWKHANKLNWLYNYFLEQRIENYRVGIKIGKKQQQAELVSLKIKDPTLKEIHSQVLQQVPLRLKRSYDKFFKKTKNKYEVYGYPKFRSCKKFFGICYPQFGYKLNNNKFETTAYGVIVFNKHRELKGTIKTITINCKNNVYFLNIVTDYICERKSAGSIGIDIGLKDLVVTNTGVKIKNCTHAKYFDKHIDNIQSRMSYLKKGSKQYKFLRGVKHRLYDVKVRKLNDFQHKVSKKLGSTYDTIYVEDLFVKRMSEGNWKNLNRSIWNAKLAQFISFLKYKTNNLVLVNPYNTSKTCNNCGNIKTDLKLSERTITCEKCGSIYDRDENAAKNIFCLGQAMMASPSCAGSLTIREALIMSSSPVRCLDLY